MSSSNIVVSTEQPASKRLKRTSMPAKLVSDYSLAGSIDLGELTRANMCQLASVSGVPGEQALYFQLSGGGEIPRFGYELVNDKKTNFALSIGSESDQSHLRRLGDELVTVVAAKWSKWFPEDPRPIEYIREKCNSFVSLPKQKTNGDGHWPGVTKTFCENRDMDTGACKLKAQGTGLDVAPAELPGMNWTRAIFKLGIFYMQSSKSFGITKKLVYLECAENNRTKKHDPADAIRVEDFSLLPEKVVIGTPSKLNMRNIAGIQSADGKPLMYRLSAGGSIPSFGVEYTNDSKYTITVNVGSKEEHDALVRLREEFIQNVVTNRDLLFPESTASPESLRDNCHVFVSDRKKKQTGDSEWPGLTKASCTDKDLTEGLCTIVCADTGDVIAPLDLPGMEWKTAVYELGFVYIQSSKTYGLSRRLRRMEVVHKDTFDIVPV